MNRTELVEVMARAIASTAYDGIYFTTRSREQYVDAAWKDHETDATTALSAIEQAGFVVVPRGLVDATQGLLRSEYESEDPGLCDCIDNSGKPYQSQYLADQIAKAEVILASLQALDKTQPIEAGRIK